MNMDTYFRECPTNKAIEQARLEDQKDKEGFTKVTPKKRTSIKQGESTSKNTIETQNPYEVLDSNPYPSTKEKKRESIIAGTIQTTPIKQNI